MAFDNPNPIFHGGGYSSSDDDDDDVFDIHSTKITRSEIYGKQHFLFCVIPH